MEAAKASCAAALKAGDPPCSRPAVTENVHQLTAEPLLPLCCRAVRLLARRQTVQGAVCNEVEVAPRQQRSTAGQAVHVGVAEARADNLPLRSCSAGRQVGPPQRELMARLVDVQQQQATIV